MLILHSICLPPSKRGAEARTAQSAAAHKLLDEVAAALRLPNAPVVTTDKGRPYFEGLSNVDFSLTHTSSLAACALQCSEGKNPPRIGIDAEVLTSLSDAKITAFSLRFFGKHEQDYLEHAADRRAAFTEIFVRKEAYAKQVGNGLGKHLSATDTGHPDFEQTAGVRFYKYRRKDIFICLCVSRNCDEKPTWFNKSPRTKQ